MRWFGAVLIAVAGVGLGMFGAHRQFRRAEWLAGVVSLLTVLEERLSFSSAPLAVLWSQLLVGEHTARLPLVRDVADGLRQHTLFEEAFMQAVDTQVAAGMLLPSEQQLLYLLAGSIGRSGLDRQSACICRCREGLERAQRMAATDAAAKAPIWRMAGLAGGVSLALLLL